MLHLTRKEGETIHIGEDIVIVVKELSSKYVRVGITAPKEVEIWRGELLNQKEQDKGEK